METEMSTLSTTQSALSASPSSVLSGVRRHPLMAYFGLTFTWTWALLVPFALDRNPNGLSILPLTLPDAAFFLAFVLATFGPLLAGLFVTGALEGKAGVRRL